MFSDRDWNRTAAIWTIIGVFANSCLGLAGLALMWWSQQKPVAETKGAPLIQHVVWWPPLMLLLAIVGSGWLHYLAASKPRSLARRQLRNGTTDKLTIYSAFYGTPVNYESVVDTLPQQNTGAMAAVVSNNLVPKDPVPNVPKHIKVKYSYGDDTIREIMRMEDELLVLPEDPFLLKQLEELKEGHRVAILALKEQLTRADSSSDSWQSRCDTVEASKNELTRELERVMGELSVLKAKLTPKPVLEYRHITNGGNMCFEGRIGVCSLQVVTIRNTRLPVPALARKVSASIEYIRDENTDRLLVAAATWKNMNPSSHDMPGTIPTSTIDLESNEEQELIVSVQDKTGRVVASPEEGHSFQELSLGHWNVLITVKSDSVPPLKLRGGLTVGRNVADNRMFVQFDNPAFSVLEG